MSFSFLSRTLYSVKSPVNGEIKVVEWLGRKSLRVGGLEQSGPMVRGIWKKTFRAVSESRVKRCLILGLGGGTTVHLIAKNWPGAKIVGVEIDPKIIKIGREFFGLKEIENLKIVKANAFGYFKVLAGGYKKFDLVLVDLYLGDYFPKEAEDQKFLKNLKRILAKNGVIIFNRLRTDNTQVFKKDLENQFSKVKVVKTPANLFFLARKD